MNEENHDSEDEQEVHTEPKRSKRTRVEKSFGPEFLTYLLENEPQNYEEAVSSSKGPLWKKQLKVKLILFYRIILGACRSSSWLQTLGSK